MLKIAWLCFPASEGNLGNSPFLTTSTKSHEGNGDNDQEKERVMMRLFFIFLLCCSFGLAGGLVTAAPVDPVSPGERCSVCGMLVAKYEPWITQIHAEGEKPVMFDGVKDMMAYYFNPTAYSGKGEMSSAEIWVKDYYTLGWIDGRKAIYVVGSDVMGPMGEELIPFTTRKAAENFMKDHKATQLILFDEIGQGMIMSMKKKHMMKMKKMKGMQQKPQ